MTTLEPSAIDEKKAEEKGTTTEKADWGGFFINFSSGLITTILIGVVCVGSIGLFFSKAANANIFPTDINMQPYTNVKRDLNVEITYMNPVKILPYYGLGFWTDPEKYWIQEANFFNPEANINFMDKFFETWLCSLQKKDKSPFWVFETDVLQNMMCMSFVIFSSIFFYMNYLPEWLIMILFGFFFFVIIYVIYISNFIYGIYTHIIKYIDLITYLLFPANKKVILNDYPGIIMYSIFYFWAAFISVMITPAIITTYTLFKALTVNYTVRKKDNDTEDKTTQKMNLVSFIKNVFYYKKTFIIILTMMKLILSANSYLGSSYMIGVIIAILILIFGLKILIPSDADDSLFSVLNDKFPPLDQQVPKKGSPIDMCNKEVNKDLNINTNIETGISNITKQPLNVLKTNLNKSMLTRSKEQSAPLAVSNDSNKNMIGGKRENIKTKQKIYKIKLV
jgi:hypothetical protein